MARHNYLRDGVTDLAGKTFTLSHVRNNPLIFAGCTVKKPKSKPSGTSGSTDWDGETHPEETE